MRGTLTYANVVSTLIVAALRVGGTPFAAGQFAKNSVGKKQLKANSVVTAKIKKNAVTKAKIRNGALGGAKVADGSVTSAQVNAASTPFSQGTSRLRTTSQAAAGKGAVYPIGTITQNAGEDAIYLAYADVTFSPACQAPRTLQLSLLKDALNPAEPESFEKAGAGAVVDEAGASGSLRVEFHPSPMGGAGMQDIAPASATPHVFNVVVEDLECDSGSGATLVGGGLDVIGMR